MEHNAAKLQPHDDSSELELHQASFRGDLKEVKRLVDEDRNPLRKDKYRRTALHRAVTGGRMEVLKYFIEERGLVPACTGQYNRTLLHTAAEFKHLDIVCMSVFYRSISAQVLNSAVQACH